jgi:DUF971 family protein
MDSTPTAIRLDVEANRLHVTWGDGHESTYDGGYLRFVCPCAMCRGHGPGQVPPPAWGACRDVKITHAEAVGGYALRFTLSDGHDTGIYTFELLREVCPSGREDLDEAGRPPG